MIGQLNQEILDSVLETLPVEFSVIDHEDRVLSWNKHDTRIFKRPKGVVGRNVRDCHPKKSLDKVKTILGEMKSGKREKAQFWIDLHIEEKKESQKILIEYYALRNAEGRYLGCLEVSQNVTEIQKIQGQKRLLD